MNQRDVDNPAQRLLDFVRTMSTSYPDTRGYDALALMLDINRDVEPETDWMREVALAWSNFGSLLDQTRVRISTFDDINPTPYIKALSRLAQSFVHWSPHDNVAGLLGNLLEADLDALESVADMLQRRTPHTRADPTDRRVLWQRVTDLVDEVQADADLSQNSKRFIVEHLARVEHLLRYYHLFGADALQREVHAAIGELAIRPDLVTAAKADKTGAWGKFLRAVAAASLLITTSQAALGMAKEVLAIGSGDDTPVEINVEVDLEMREVEPGHFVFIESEDEGPTVADEAPSTTAEDEDEVAS